MAKQDDYTRYTIRLPTPLYERVKDAAGEASVNSLIVEVLEEKYPAPEPTDWDTAMARLDDILKAMDEIIASYGRADMNPEDLSAKFKQLREEHEAVLVGATRGI